MISYVQVHTSEVPIIEREGIYLNMTQIFDLTIIILQWDRFYVAKSILDHEDEYEYRLYSSLEELKFDLSETTYPGDVHYEDPWN